ncbi:glutaredoxin family protein [Paenisporosarcina indica]|uniref:glutaredoxin family protein n=1 Tax=Paenisporosarcina indica TaxID=650093 RepID=UPI00094F934B|nr:glutaredoxin family protein [Paenisporosarcina indica]
MRVQFYSRPNCPLCEEASLMLRMVEEDVPLEIETINIEDDDTIHEKYMLRIPVIISEGKVIQEGRIDYPTLIEAFSS